MSHHPNIAATAAATVAATIAGVMLLDLAAGGAWVEHMQAAEQWCNSLNGTMTVERAMIDGGAHCQTPDGELIRYEGQNL